MKILLINPPDDLDALLGRGAQLLSALEPLGLLYIAAVARNAGYDVEVIDAYAEKLLEEELFQRIRKSGADIIGFTTFTSNGQIVYRLGKRIKTELPKKIVVFGNVHAMVYAKEYLSSSCCDAVVHGEGEYVFLDIIRVVESGSKDFTNIKEVSCMFNGSVVGNRCDGLVSNLSVLPKPARDLVDRKWYNFAPISNLAFSGGKNDIGKHLFTSRGCPNRCTFCTVHRSMKVRFNDVKKTVDEIEQLVDEYQAQYIFITDSLFICNRKRVFEICKEIRKRKLKIKWGCEGHVRWIDENLIKEMERAGCFDIALGIESGNQISLDIVKKNNTIQQAIEAVKTIKKVSKIHVQGLFILGLPGESYNDCINTIKFAKSLPLDMAQFSILTPYPGSKIYDDLVASGELDNGVRPNGELDTDIWHRYSAYASYVEQDPIWVTPELSADQLKKLQKMALRKFYFRPKYFWSQLKRVKLKDISKVASIAKDTFF
jgi:radical SAM superfamily enzyme YgiQ (UPF0313 family)